MTVKPAYRVPTMEEIRAIPWNGLNVVSTFSGGGGSSTGYRMAGFRVLWASEFVPAARDTYRANASPSTVLDDRDIREVKAEDILEATGLERGQLDLFDGSPPCASFSTSGQREQGWGTVKTYSDVKQRSDDLFYEFARLLEGLQPRAFIAENVSGLVKGSAKGYFKRILAALRETGYVVEARLLDAVWLGVPQARQRLIFQGVRADLGVAPAFPKPLPYRYTIGDALPDLRAVRYDTSGTFDPKDLDVERDPVKTLTVSGGAAPYHFKVWDHADVEQVTTDPETGKDIRISGYAIGKEWASLAPGQQSDRYQNLRRSSAERPAQTVTAMGGAMSAASITHPTQPRKFTLGELRALGGFPPDFVLTGTYEQRWERIGRAVPPVMMAAIASAVRDGVLR